MANAQEIQPSGITPVLAFGLGFATTVGDNLYRAISVYPPLSSSGSLSAHPMPLASEPLCLPLSAPAQSSRPTHQPLAPHPGV